MKTLVLYQNPAAHGDVLEWGAKMNIVLNSNQSSWFLKICHEDGTESIKIMPINELNFNQDCSKLVIYGSVSKKDLIRILNHVHIEEK